MHSGSSNLADTFNYFIPKNRLGDRIFSLAKFIINHKRLPSNQKKIFSEMLYYLKTSGEILDPLRVLVTDKEYVKLYVKATVGDQYNVPTINIIRSPSEIDHVVFPSECCLKPTHASGYVILRENNEELDLVQMKRWFSINHYDKTREANYKYLKPKIIVEPLLFLGKQHVIDYRFFCYKGQARMIMVDFDSFINRTRKLFDSDWNELDYTIHYEKNETYLDKPEKFDEMKNIAERLSPAFDFVRIDFFIIGSKIYVGEITHCHANASQEFIPKNAELTASQMIFCN